MARRNSVANRRGLNLWLPQGWQRASVFKTDWFHTSVMDLGQLTTGRRPIVALDPGVRNFFTGYDPCGRVIEWGIQDHRRLVRKKLFGNEEVSDLVAECHHKLSSYLTTNYDCIALPRFGVHTLWNHPLFLTTLQKKAQSTGCRLMIVDERDTTIVCTNCRSRNTPSPRKTFYCSGCGYSIGRDINAARNILIKALGGTL